MAIYHFASRILTRTKGHNAVGAAAHQAGERLTDWRDGRVYDFSRKPAVVHADLLLPGGAPAWMRDRAAFWNEVERIEDAGSRRASAQLARDFDMALPRELPMAANIALARVFVRAEFVLRGMACDMAIHAPVSVTDGLVQPHLHLLVALREVTPEGFGNKVRAWSSRALFKSWREQWAVHVNAALERAGVAERVDHRSFRDQGVNREPGLHVGRAAWEMEQRGVVTERGARWREARKRREW